MTGEPASVNNRGPAPGPLRFVRRRLVTLEVKHPKRGENQSDRASSAQVNCHGVGARVRFVKEPPAARQTTERCTKRRHLTKFATRNCEGGSYHVLGDSRLREALPFPEPNSHSSYEDNSSYDMQAARDLRKENPDLREDHFPRVALEGVSVLDRA